jgi:hypothetical protein
LSWTRKASTRLRSASLCASRAFLAPAERRKEASARSVLPRWVISSCGVGPPPGDDRYSTVSSRSYCRLPMSSMPGLPTVFSTVRADSRLNAGPAVRTVAKIQSASSATSGTLIKAMIFERIDQLRLLIRLRPRVGSVSSPTSPARRPVISGDDRRGAAHALGRIRKTFNCIHRPGVHK